MPSTTGPSLSILTCASKAWHGLPETEVSEFQNHKLLSGVRPALRQGQRSPGQRRSRTEKSITQAHRVYLTLRHDPQPPDGTTAVQVKDDNHRMGSSDYIGKYYNLH